MVVVAAVVAMGKPTAARKKIEVQGSSSGRGSSSKYIWEADGGAQKIEVQGSSSGSGSSSKYIGEADSAQSTAWSCSARAWCW